MLRHYNNTSLPLPLQTAIDNSDDTLEVTSTSRLPNVPFIVSIERGTVREEACLVTAKTATTLTVTRGFDGTNPTAHDVGALVEHTTVALDYREAGVVPLTEEERDSLEGEDLWDGRVIFNQDSGRVEVAYPGGGWDQILPTGAIIPFGGTVVPAGFLVANGQAVSRTDYAALFALIGTTFGSGDGSTTFNLPDLRQRMPLGKGDSGVGSVLGETGGSLNHTHTQPSHRHTGPSHSHTNPNTSAAGSHFHTQGPTSTTGAHTHTNPRTGNASVGGLNPDAGTSGLLSQTDATHSHGGSTVGPADPAHQHDHPQGNTGSAGAHSHSNPNTSTVSAHIHTQGNTQPAGTGLTGAAGGEDTGSANPPYIVLHFLVRT